MPVKNFRELDAWRVAVDLALLIYELIDVLPADERFEMASQMRRAALSVPSNVAEGHGTRLRGRYRHHVMIALGSVAELTTCVELGSRLGYWDMPTVDRMNGELVRMSQLLHGVLRSIRVQIAAEAGIMLLAVGACLISL
jgi:four helix bundle protein